MNKKLKYLNTTVSTITLALLLLVNSSLSFANETPVSTSIKDQKTLSAKQQTVNLNTSTLEQLVTLKGIGHTKAQAIIDYRQSVGKFKSINELSRVSGIGAKIVNENKTRLSI